MNTKKITAIDIIFAMPPAVVVLIFLSITLCIQPTRSQSQGQSGTLAAPAIGQNSNITQINGAFVNTDPCGSWGTVKVNWAPVARAQITTATTTLLIPAVAGKADFVCGYQTTVSSATTPSTIQFEYGTQTTNPCDTGTTTITPILNAGTVGVLTFQQVVGFAETTIMSTPASQQFCLVSTVGTTPSIGIWGTMVQQ
jgi:hypothetical protein